MSPDTVRAPCRRTPSAAPLSSLLRARPTGVALSMHPRRGGTARTSLGRGCRTGRLEGSRHRPALAMAAPVVAAACRAADADLQRPRGMIRTSLTHPDPEAAELLTGPDAGRSIHPPAAQPPTDQVGHLASPTRVTLAPRLDSERMISQWCTTTSDRQISSRPGEHTPPPMCSTAGPSVPRLHPPGYHLVPLTQHPGSPLRVRLPARYVLDPAARWTPAPGWRSISATAGLPSIPATTRSTDRLPGSSVAAATPSMPMLTTLAIVLNKMTRSPIGSVEVPPSKVGHGPPKVD